ncbi:MAG: hypothetical protein WCS34_07110 [Bacteroidales bacterium]
MKLGLIGYPISHSKSPALFKKANPNSSSTYDLIETPSFDEAFERFMTEYDIINVTAPFKELAFAKADIKEKGCERIGATNLLIKKEGKILAYNTDKDGVKICLKDCMAENRLARENYKRALIVGCGGAAMAAAVACQEMGFAVTITNRNLEKAVKFAERIGAKSSALPQIIENIRANDIIIYALPICLNEIKDLDFEDKIVLEANYRNPSISSKNAQYYIKGDKWLQAQADAMYDIINVSF